MLLLLFIQVPDESIRDYLLTEHIESQNQDLSFHTQIPEYRILATIKDLLRKAPENQKDWVALQELIIEQLYSLTELPANYIGDVYTGNAAKQILINYFNVDENSFKATSLEAGATNQGSVRAPENIAKGQSIFSKPPANTKNPRHSRDNSSCLTM